MKHDEADLISEQNMKKLMNLHSIVFLGLSGIPPHERLLNGRTTSVHWRLAFVTKASIHCSV